MNKVIDNEKIIKGDYFIWKSSSIDRVSDESMKVSKSFGFDVWRLSVFGKEIWSLRGHYFFSKHGRISIWFRLNIAFLYKTEKRIKLLVSHETIFSSQLESYGEIRILIIIMNRSESKRWEKFNDDSRIRRKSIKRKIKHPIRRSSLTSSK